MRRFFRWWRRLNDRFNRWFGKPRILFAYIVGAAPAMFVAGIGGGTWGFGKGIAAGFAVWAVVGGLVYTFVNVEGDEDGVGREDRG